MTAAARAAAATEAVWDAVTADNRAVLVNSPPGAGKSTLVREVARRAAVAHQVPVVVQTNEQADDLVRGFLRDTDHGAANVRVGRLHRDKYAVPDDLAGDPRATASAHLHDLDECDVVVATGHKWGFVDADHHWPFGLVDEAYQMRSDRLLPVGARMERLLLVGDPGQLAPFTDTDDRPLRGLPGSPIDSAAATILTTHPEVPQLALPMSWRLPPSATALVADAFYSFPFDAASAPTDREMRMPLAAVANVRQAALHAAADTGWAMLALPDLLMPTQDPEAVESIAGLVHEALDARPELHDDRPARRLRPADIAVGVTHRDQRAAVTAAVDAVCDEHGLPPGSVTVDTANRLQGREYELVIAWHPLSGRRDATSFHLEAGRLCVLLSRHRHACVVVARAGIREQLEAHPSVDPLWLGERLPVVDGWSAHLAVLDHLEPLSIAS